MSSLFYLEKGMPKHLIRRYLPDPEKIARTPGLGFLRHRLEDPNLWHLNRRSASGARFWGLWCAFLPMPFQTVPAAIAALVFRVNLPLAIVLCWISNPLTMLPVIYVGYDLGALILNRPLLGMDEISKLIGKVERAGYALVPLDLHFLRGRIKLEIGLAKGKKQHDKRASELEKDSKREAQRAMKEHQR